MESATFSDYEIEMFSKLETLPFNTYFPVSPDRKDYDQFIAMVKKRIDIFDDFIFSDDYSKIRRCKPQKEVIKEIMQNDKCFVIDWRKTSEVEFNWDHLPPPVFTPQGKGVKRRA